MKRSKFTTSRGEEAKRWRIVEAKAIREERNARRVVLEPVDLAETPRAIRQEARSK